MFKLIFFIVLIGPAGDHSTKIDFSKTVKTYSECVSFYNKAIDQATYRVRDSDYYENLQPSAMVCEQMVGA